MKLTDFYKKYEMQIGVSYATFKRYSRELEGVKIHKIKTRSTYIVVDEEKLISSWLKK